MFNINKKKDSLSNMTELDKKVEEFLEWNQKTFFSDVSLPDYRDMRVARDFIEKMAVWYELKYPEDVLYRIYSNSTTTEDIERDKYFNTKDFIESLNDDEYELLKRPDYCPNVVVVSPYFSMKLRLTKKGIITEVEEFQTYISGIPDFRGMHITEAINIIDKILKKYDSRLEKNSDKSIRTLLADTSDVKKRKEGILDSVMYRIIERGGVRVGPRRALLFAQEFNRDISIPMIYGVDTTDPHLRDFICDYLKLGGDKNLVCKKNYLCYRFYEGKEVSVADLLYRPGLISDRTSEEKEVLSRIAGLLISQVDEQAVRHENAETLRLRKAIEKGKRRKAEMEKNS